MGGSTQKTHAFLMFDGNAEEAMNFYISIFSKSEIKRILHQEDGTALMPLAPSTVSGKFGVSWQLSFEKTN